MSKPSNLLHFVYLDGFTDDWNEIASDQDEMRLWDLEMIIMSAPDAAPVIPGSDGLRKMRIGKDGSGKRGGGRVLYAYFPSHHLVLMAIAYSKADKSDLSRSELSVIRRVIGQIKMWLDQKT